MEQAIQELGYVPNRAARALVTQRTDSVALVVSESEERVFGEPFFAGIVRGISSMLLETPLQLWLAMAQSPGRAGAGRAPPDPQHVDGVLLLSLHGDDPLPTLLAERGLPVVLGGRPAAGCSDRQRPDRAVVDVGQRRRRPGRRWRTCSRRGRRRVAAIAGPQDMGVGMARLAGYREALQAAGLPVDEST